MTGARSSSQLLEFVPVTSSKLIVTRLRLNLRRVVHSQSLRLPHWDLRFRSMPLNLSIHSTVLSCFIPCSPSCPCISSNVFICIASSGIPSPPGRMSSLPSTSHIVGCQRTHRQVRYCPSQFRVYKLGWKYESHGQMLHEPRYHRRLLRSPIRRILRVECHPPPLPSTALLLAVPTMLCTAISARVKLVKPHSEAGGRVEL